MPTIGVNVAIIRDGKILLTQRDDFHVWCMPGGHMDPGETLPQAAVREALEETGYEIALTRLVGIYSRPRWDMYHIAVFAAEITGGREQGQPGEVIDMAFFGPHEIPDALLLGQRHRILDAFSTRQECVAWLEDYPLPFGRIIPREELYQLRDESGLPGQEFYRRYMTPVEAGGILREVGPGDC